MEQTATNNTPQPPLVASLFFYEQSSDRPPAFVLGQITRRSQPRRRSRSRPPVTALSAALPTALPTPLSERFGLFCSSIVNKTPVELGPPAKGTIRILVPPYNPSSCNHLEQIIHRHDRSIKEWHALFAEYESKMYFKDENAAIAAELRAAYYKNMRIRGLIQSWVARVRACIMNRRTVGDPDLYTVAPIPANVRVSVYDWHTKSRYVFHANTILQTILTSLKYNNYGIASPQAPRNPYTNIPWTFGQCMSIMEQIMVYQARIHRFLPPILELYRNAAYDVRELTAEKYFIMHIWAADTFFADRSDPVVREIYMEVVDEMERDVHDTEGLWLIIRYEVERRKLSEALMKRWDALVVAYWIWQNHSIAWMDGRFQDYINLDDALQDLYGESVRWYNAHNPYHANYARRRRAQRSPLPLPVTPPMTITAELALANRLIEETRALIERNESSTTINIVVETSESDTTASASPSSSSSGNTE